jgi:hypothetical protein
MNLNQWIKLELFVPAAALEPVLAALESAGAGQLPTYDRCRTVAPVTGHWRPLAGASPHQGEVGADCSAPELKIETFCPIRRLRDVQQAVAAAHPYEAPVMYVHVLAAPPTGWGKR